MSKIFEALQKAQGELAELALPVVQEVGTPTPAAVPEPAPAVRSEAAKPSAAPPTPARPPAPGPIDLERSLESIRTFSLHISATAPILPFGLEQSRAGEQYRIARTHILHHATQPRLLTVSSAGSGDGKTVTSINLAGALALKSDANVLLVDADLRRSSIASLLGIADSPGLAEVLSGSAKLEDALVRVEQFPNLYVLPAGKAGLNPGELLDSPRWEAACGAFRRLFKFVVFDTPPIGSVTDYDLIQVATDGVVLVTRPDHTNRRLFQQALRVVPPSRLLGVVMNYVPRWFLWKTHDYYYYSARA